MDDARANIMLVDDNIAILTAGRQLLKPFYNVYTASSAALMFEVFKKVLPDLILLDVSMPQMDGHEIIRILKKTKRFAAIPVIFLTALNDDASELMGFDLGAADYVSKPFSPRRLLKRVENQLLILRQRATIQHHADNLEALVRQKTREAFSLQNAMLGAVAELAEYRDKFAAGHGTHSRLYLRAMLDGMRDDAMYAEEIASWDEHLLLSAAPLHDVGKIAIPDAILNKPGKLTPEEFAIMKTHVTIGMEVVKKMLAGIPGHSFMDHALRIVGAHHEKWNGSGYPAGLKGEDIPLEGRLMAFADVYDALVSWRPYRKPHSHEEARALIAGGAGSHFDPSLTEVFLRAEGEFRYIMKRREREG